MASKPTVPTVAAILRDRPDAAPKKLWLAMIQARETGKRHTILRIARVAGLAGVAGVTRAAGVLGSAGIAGARVAGGSGGGRGDGRAGAGGASGAGIPAQGRGAHLEKIIGSVGNLLKIALVGICALLCDARLQIAGVILEVGHLCFGTADTLQVLWIGARFGTLATLVGHGVVVPGVHAGLGARGELLNPLVVGLGGGSGNSGGKAEEDNREGQMHGVEWFEYSLRDGGRKKW